jgi:uncharacterized membrane protein YdjX (TVP38/TMEM64 family)/Fe-S oxidoreductase
MNIHKETTAMPYSSSLESRLDHVVTHCTECEVCVAGCAFLKKYGTPKAIGEGLRGTGEKGLTRAFECSLCGLCSAGCPAELDIDGLFLEMRREAVDRGLGDYDEHKPLLAYERLGASRRFTFYGIPEGCATVFFPGCALPGSRPAAVKKMYAALRKKDPKIGIVLDCCAKPSHSLGRERHARSMLEEMGAYLVDQGVREVLVACSNCHNMFTAFGQGLAVKTVYEALADMETLAAGQARGTVVVHDSCVARNLEPVHDAVRRLLRRQGLTVEEMEHTGRQTLCCGQGGAVNLLAPELAAGWGLLRKKEAQGRRMATYCAGCARALNSLSATSHVADLIFEPEKALAGKLKPASGPLTYLNRLLLKRTYSRMEGFAATRERTFTPEEAGPKRRPWKIAVFVILLAAAVISVHLSGATHYLEQERLRALISGYGALAPVIYMLIYTLAPVFFLPGLPITIVGGILFGPFWGVVYAIFGSTCGAALAFLVARYVAREWVMKKLTGPKWERLDQETAKHGWKAVAVVRLIPAFPFNLVNYAFGLTKVPLIHYVAATFICMLPACIAFIVFSSSLLDLVRGSVSPAALVGVALIVAVSLIPLIYRRFKKKRSGGTPGE